MATIIQNKWDNGQAEDVRTTSLNQNALSQNFDTITEPHRLNPMVSSVAESPTVVADSEMSDVLIGQVAGNNYYVGIGYESQSSYLTTFYTKTNVNGTFSKQAVGNYVYSKGSGVAYKNQVYAVEYQAGSPSYYNLIRFDGANSVTTVGSATVSSSSSTVLQAHCFVHPEDNILYMLVGDTISKWDGTTFSTVSTILPTGFSVSSVTNYGTYLAITMNSDTNSLSPVCYLWGRDTSINTLQETIDLGEGSVAIVENLNNNLIFVMSVGGYGQTVLDERMMIKEYAGNTVETLVNLVVGDLVGDPYSYKAKSGNHLYFVTANSDCIWSFGKNKTGNYVLNQSRFIINGDKVTGYTYPYIGSIGGLSMIGDIIWVAGYPMAGGDYIMMRTLSNSDGIAYAGTSIYKTTINPNMPIIDRYDEKQLEAVQVSFTGSGGTIQIKYSVDGSEMSALIPTSENTTTLGKEDVIIMTNEDGGEPLLSGREFQFQIESYGGVKIKELRYKYTNLNTTI